MTAVAETTAAQTAGAAAGNAAAETADADAFTRELHNRLAPPEPTREEKIAAGMEKLAAAFPDRTVTNQRIGGDLASAAAYFLEIDSGTGINISPEVMEQFGEDDALFEKLKNMIGSLFTASGEQTLLPAQPGGNMSTRMIVIEMEQTRFVEVQRDEQGRALSMASLKLQTQQLVADSMQKLFESLGGGSSGGGASFGGADGLWRMLAGGGAGGASRNQGFIGFVSGSVSWELEAMIAQEGNPQQMLESNRQLVGQMDVIIDMWEQSGTSADLFTYMQVMGLSDPLVFDLGDEGINLTSAEDGVYFDIKGDGSKPKTGWISGNNAFLYLDENGNGTADDAHELFGDHGGYSNGFDKLAQHDDNGDGVIDAQDAVYDELRLWRDLNGDGVNQGEESLTLAQAGIASINLRYDKTYEKDKHGNVVGERSSFTRADGSQGLVVDAWLRQGK